MTSSTIRSKSPVRARSRPRSPWSAVVIGVALVPQGGRHHVADRRLVLDDQDATGRCAADHTDAFNSPDRIAVDDQLRHPSGSSGAGGRRLAVRRAASGRRIAAVSPLKQVSTAFSATWLAW